MSDLSYPIGKFVPPAEYTPAGRSAAIQEIKAVPRHVRVAIAGLSPSQLLTPYREGGWTVAQVVHHIADAHVNGFVRFKWALTEDRPTIKLYDQRAWAELPEASNVDIEESLRLIDAIHGRWGATLDAMRPEDFSREFVHPDRGPQTLDRNTAMYAWHGRHHTAHITSLRARMNW